MNWVNCDPKEFKELDEKILEEGYNGFNEACRKMLIHELQGAFKKNLRN